MSHNSTASLKGVFYDPFLKKFSFRRSVYKIDMPAPSSILHLALVIRTLGQFVLSNALERVKFFLHYVECMNF